VSENKRNVMVGGRMVPGTVAQVAGNQGEPWTEYLLGDGTVLRLKVVLFEATKVDDAFEQDGTPVYITKWGVLQHSSSPDAIKKQV